MSALKLVAVPSGAALAVSVTESGTLGPGVGSGGVGVGSGAIAAGWMATIVDVWSGGCSLIVAVTFTHPPGAVSVDVACPAESVVTVVGSRLPTSVCNATRTPVTGQ